MRRLNGLALVLLWPLFGACVWGTAPTPAPPNELLFVATPSGHAVVQARTGRTVASLPPGPLAIGLTGGGDVAEAWLLTPTTGGHRLLRLNASASFAATQVADEAVGGVAQAALVPAPLLNTFSGQKTVLVARFGDGSLVGYQNGVPIWRRPRGSASDVRWVEGAVYDRGAGGGPWPVLKPESGDVGPWLSPGCQPVASVGTDLAQLCFGGLVFRDQGLTVPIATPWSAATFDGGAILGWPDGGVARLPARGRARFAQTSALVAPPAAAPDIDQAYALHPSGALTRISFSGGKTTAFAAQRDALAVGVSRDGNYVYVLGGGRLEVVRSADGHLTGNYAAEGTAIEYVAG